MFQSLFVFTILAFFSLMATAAQAPSALAPDRVQVPEIVQDTYGVASAAEYPAIQTYGVSTCIVVGLYDASVRVGGLMHVSASTDIHAAVKLVLADLKRKGSAKPQHLSAQLMGGWGDSMDQTGMHFESTRMAEQLMTELINRGVAVISNTTITEMRDVNAGRPALINPELDLNTGALYLYNQTLLYQGPPIARPMPTAVGI